MAWHTARPHAPLHAHTCAFAPTRPNPATYGVRAPALPALPAIGRDLAIAQPNDRQLIISVYFLGLGIGSLLFGVLSDRYGRKKVLAWAMLLFILSSMACAAAQTSGNAEPAEKYQMEKGTHVCHSELTKAV